MDTDTELMSPPDSDMEYSEIGEDNFPGSCIHVSNYKREFVLDDYRHLYSFYVACINKDSFKRKKHDCVCCVQSCETNRTRIHACLYCIYFGCFDVKDGKFSHINLHARSKNHPLGMDTDSGNVFCFECNDYKYDLDFEEIRQEQNLIANHQRGITTCATYNWEPNLDELNLLKWHEIVYDSKSGIRGFVNINTAICFMITVIQTLIHAPAFRDYLLSFKHICKRKKKTDYPSCFICEMAKIMQEDRVEFFATTEHHDAHEFLEPFLCKLCEDCEESNLVSCNCTIHTTFAVSWLTKYTCHKCNKVTTSHEQSTWFIVLTSLGESVSSLTDCFKSVSSRYVLFKSITPEVLQLNSKEINFLLENARCTLCSGKTDESKFVLKKLPTVLTFSSNLPDPLMKTKTVQQVVKFKYKEFLNIFPENVKDGEKWLDMISENPEYQYYLFSVIEVLPGHYKVYIKKDKNQWFCCDSKDIEPRPLEKILNIKTPKMLFYHKQFL